MALLIAARIALRGKHHAQRGEVVPLERRLAAVGHGAEDVDDVALQTRQHHLGLGVAETGVELDDLDALGRLHQTAVEYSREGTALLHHRIGRTLHDVAQRELLVLGRDEGQGRIGSHAARIGTLVAVEGALVVLSQHHGPHLVTRDETHERKFGALEEILDDDLTLAETVVEQHPAQRLVGLLHRGGNHHALAGCQAVVLEHGRPRTRGDVGARLFVVGEGVEPGRRHAILGHQPLGKLLRGFDARGSLRRTEDAQPRSAEDIDHTGGQRHLGTDDRKTDALGSRKITQPLDLRVADVDALGHAGDAGIARCAVNLFHLCRTRQRIDDGVLAAAASYYQYLHMQTVVCIVIVMR